MHRMLQPRAPDSPKCQGLQPQVLESAAPSARGCNPMYLRLQPHVLEAATACVRCQDLDEGEVRAAVRAFDEEHEVEQDEAEAEWAEEAAAAAMAAAGTRPRAEVATKPTPKPTPKP